MKNNKNMKIILIILVSVLLAGCISKQSTILGKNNTNSSMISIKYLEDNGPIISNDSNVLERYIFLAPINLSNTIETESAHGGGMIINAKDNIPQGFRIYGISETYNSSKKYVLVQYKVFDSDVNNDLNNSIDLTVHQYVGNGFNTKIVRNINNSIASKGRIIVLESNGSSANITNVPKGNNVIIILFGFDTMIGKIGVEDNKNLSLNESLDILNTFYDKIKIKNGEELSNNNFSMHV